MAVLYKIACNIHTQVWCNLEIITKLLAVQDSVHAQAKDIGAL